MQFVRIERGRAAANVLQVENPDNLVNVQLLTIVLGRPAEQAEIIADSFRKITASEVVIHTSAFVALAHFCPIAVENEWNVRVVRRRCAQRANELDVLWSIREMIFATDYVGDFHFKIVDHVDEMKNP